MSNPWLALSTYQEKHEKSFFGRDDDKDNLFSMLQQNETVICYAASGEGKSSLIKAGLCPKLRRSDMFPVNIIFASDNHFDKESEFDEFVLQSINQSFKDFEKQIAVKVEDLGIKKEGEFGFVDVTNIFSSVSNSLWWKLRTQKIHSPYGGAELTPVLIFDQFEEIFRVPWKALFFSWLQKLTNDVCPDEIIKDLKGEANDLPNRKLFKLLFSMRYEYVGELDYWCSQRNFIPQMMRNRYFLKPMAKDTAVQVIINNSVSPDDKISALMKKEENAKAIVDALSTYNKNADGNDTIKDNNTVSALAVSLVCYVLYQRLSEMPERDEDILQSQLSKTIPDSKELNKLIYSFYEGKMRDLNYSDERYVLERTLISSNHTRLRIPVANDNLQKIQLSKHLEEEKSIVTEHIAKTETINGEAYIEFVHDSLAAAISDQLEKRKKKKIRRWIVIGGIIVVLATLVASIPSYMRKSIPLKSSIRDEPIPETPTLKHYEVDNEVFELHNAYAKAPFYVNSDKVAKIVYDGFNYNRSQGLKSNGCTMFMFPNTDSLIIKSWHGFTQFYNASFLPNLKLLEIKSIPNSIDGNSFPVEVKSNVRICINDSVSDYYHYDNGCLFAKANNVWYVMMTFEQDHFWLGEIYYDSVAIPQLCNSKDAKCLHVYDLAKPRSRISIPYTNWWNQTYYKIICSDTTRKVLEYGSIPDSVLSKAIVAEFDNIETIDTGAFSFCDKKKFGSTSLKCIRLPQAQCIKDYPTYNYNSTSILVYAPRLNSLIAVSGRYGSPTFMVDTALIVSFPNKFKDKIIPIEREQSLQKTSKTSIEKQAAKAKGYHFSDDGKTLIMDSLEIPKLRIKKNVNQIYLPSSNTTNNLDIRNVLSIKKIHVNLFNKNYISFHGHLFSKTAFYGSLYISPLCVVDKERQIGFLIKENYIGYITPSCQEFVSITKPSQGMPQGQGEHVVLKVPYGLKEQYLHSPWNGRFRRIEEMGWVPTLWYNLLYGKKSVSLKSLIFSEFTEDFIPGFIELVGAFLLLWVTWRKYKARKKQKWLDFLVTLGLVVLLSYVLMKIHPFRETSGFSVWWHLGCLSVLLPLWLFIHYDKGGVGKILNNKWIWISTVALIAIIFLSVSLWKKRQKLLFQHQYYEFIVDSVSYSMRRMDGGTFLMGVQKDDPNNDNYVEKASQNQVPVHQVTLDGFYISQVSVTKKLWQAVMGDLLNDNLKDTVPVYVDWYDAVLFCNKLSELVGETPYYSIDTTTKDTVNKCYSDKKKWTVIRIENADGFRLPTEAEWEYANPMCDATNWCYDWYGNYSNNYQINPYGPYTGYLYSRVYRGCSNNGYSRGSAYPTHNKYSRGSANPTYKHGFRVVLPAK